MLTVAGHAVLTKVTLSTIAVDISIACCLSDWAIKQIDRHQRAFIWVGSDTVSGGRCKVTWSRVYRLMDLDGLGILDLCFFGFACLRWEWLRRTKLQQS